MRRAEDEGYLPLTIGEIFEGYEKDGKVFESYSRKSKAFRFAIYNFASKGKLQFVMTTLEATQKVMKKL